MRLSGEMFAFARGHTALNLDSASHRIDHTWELDKHPVACGLENSPVVLFDLGIKGSPMCLQGRESALFVGAH
jgi:hypothetical protein